MKLFKNEMILSILFIVTVGIIGITSYHVYISYQKYMTVQKSTKTSYFVEYFESVLRKLNHERIQSTVYLTTQNKDQLNQLKESRTILDRILWELDEFIKNHEHFVSYSANIEKVSETLDLVRKKIDDFNGNHREILIDLYHDTIFKSLLEILQSVIATQNTDAMKSYLIMYKKYTELKENTALENTLVSFNLLGEIKMSDEDTALWNHLILKDTLPPFNTLADRSIASKLNALLSAEKYHQIIAQERDMILYDARSGKYSVSPMGWSNQIDIKIDYFTQAESILRSQIQKIDQETIAQSRNILLGYSIGTLVLLLGLLRLLQLYKKIHSDRHISEETLRDIELVLNKDQQEELQRLMNHGKVDHIYKFLLKTIKDGNETKDLFLASMSHEIRTPLNGILGFTQLLKETDDKEEQAEFISVIEKSSENLLTIVNDILDLSKIKAQKIELEEIEFDPVESFEAAVESYAAKAAKENIDFNIFLDPALPTLLIGDPTKISQIIVNLISNAIKFTPKNGEVSVSIKKLLEDDEKVNVYFEVTDTGIGLTKEQQGKVFEAFSQADVSTSRKYGGTGLGLSISGKFVKLMGGKLSIKSVKDEGSTFYFTLGLQKPQTATKRILPDLSSYTVGVLGSHINKKYYYNKNLEAYIACTKAKIRHYTDESLLALKDSSDLPDILFIDHKSHYRANELEPLLNFNTKTVVISTGDQKKNLKQYMSKIDRILYKPVNFTKTLKILTNQEESSEAKKKITFENIHILVAEDNAINQKLILNVLNKLGIEVTIASNGQEALEHRMKHEYDMIFMDIQMPVMGGMEATGKIISFERSNHKEHIPIVALTANALSGDREKYISAGMDNYLSKPIELEALNHLLQEYFQDRIVQNEEDI